MDLLTFHVAGREFGIALERVIEILASPPITHFPRTPPAVRGVCPVRGAPTFVVDAGLCLDSRPIAISERTPVVVLRVKLPDGLVTLALLVEAAGRRLEIEALLPRSAALAHLGGAGVCRGFAEVDGALVTILDLDRFLASDRIAAARAVSSTLAAERASAPQRTPAVRDAPLPGRPRVECEGIRKDESRDGGAVSAPSPAPVVETGRRVRRLPRVQPSRPLAARGLLRLSLAAAGIAHHPVLALASPRGAQSAQPRSRPPHISEQDLHSPATSVERPSATSSRAPLLAFGAVALIGILVATAQGLRSGSDSPQHARGALVSELRAGTEVSEKRETSASAPAKVPMAQPFRADAAGAVQPLQEDGKPPELERTVVAAEKPLPAPAPPSISIPAPARVSVAAPTVGARASPCRLHEVRGGETLWAIAAKSLGDPERWPEIYDLNRHQLEDPHHIEIHQQIQMPGACAAESSRSR